MAEVIVVERFWRLIQAFSGTLGCAIVLCAFELWGGNPKRAPSLFLLIFSGVLALITILRFFDEDFKKTFLYVGIFQSLLFFIGSGVFIRQGLLGLDIDINQGGMIGEWVLAMIGIQLFIIAVYKFSIRVVASR